MPIEENDLSPEMYNEYVPVVFARSVGKAEEYRELLSEYDIPAMVGTDEELGNEVDAEIQARRRGMTHGLPVLAPETFLDEASEIIADNEDEDLDCYDPDEEEEFEEDEDDYLFDDLDEDIREEPLGDDDYLDDDKGDLEEDDKEF